MHVQALSQIYLSYQENVFKTSKQSFTHIQTRHRKFKWWININK